MIFYYSRSAGTIADIALVGNVFLIMGVIGIARSCSDTSWYRRYCAYNGYVGGCERADI